jgi:hypothetical protein
MPSWKLWRKRRPTRLGSIVTIVVSLIAAASTGWLTTYAAAQEGSNQMSTASAADQPARMDAATKSDAFRQVLKQMGAGQKPDPQLWHTFVAAQNDGLRTGPKIGDQVPGFTLSDQNGKSQSLHDLIGPKGLLLVFLRSADW